MFAFVCRQQIALTKRGLVTRCIKASQIQFIVCAFRSIAGAATAEKLVLSH